MTDLKEIFADNLIKLRTAAHLTQAELGERLAYSDKAVSKWERAESLPDVTVFKRIADTFGVTIDWLLCKHTDEKPPRTDAQKSANRHRIAWLAVLGVWFVAVLAFVIGCTVTKSPDGFWLAFVLALPFSFIVLIIFNSIWGRAVNNVYYISALIWTLLAFVYLLILVLTGENLWLIFFIGIPLEAAVIIWHRMLKNDKR